MRWVSTFSFVAAIAILAAGCDSSQRTAPANGPSSKSLRVDIPKGWSATRQPLTNVTDPRQLLAAASFPLRQGGHLLRSGGCAPTAALDVAHARRGALVTISEYGEGHLNDRAFHSLPRRPAALGLTPDDFGRYGCFGDGYNFQFRQHGRALIVHVAFDPGSVHSAARRKGQRLIDSLEFP